MSAKTYCLLFWIREKTVTVMEEPSDIKTSDEGGEVELFVNEKPYKAILLARSEKKTYLNNINVSTEGKIMKKGKSSSKNVAKNRNVKALSAQQMQSRKKEVTNLNKELLELQRANEAHEKGASSQSDIHSIVNEVSEAGNFKEKETGSNLNKIDVEEITEPISSNTEAENLISSLLLNVTPEVATFLEHLAIAVRKISGGKGSINIPIESSQNTLTKKIDKTKKVQVVDGELIVDPKKEIEFTRFKKRPEEMVRRIMLELIGEKELKTMTAMGQTRKGRHGKGIPEDMRTAVYTYVKDHTKGFTYDRYITVVNNQCNTLRNPKQKHKDEQSTKNQETDQDRPIERKEESDEDEKMEDEDFNMETDD